MAETITISLTDTNDETVTVTLDQAASGPAGAAGATGATGPAPSGTGFVKVTDGVLDTPSASIAQSVITNLTTDLAAKAPLVSPSFTTPSLGVATATSINGNTITAGTGMLSLGTRTISTADGPSTIGGEIALYGGNGSNADGGYIFTFGGDDASASGGNINTSGGSGGSGQPGGSINTSNGGGNINTTAGGSITTGTGSLTTGTGNLTGPNTNGTIALTSDLYVRTAQVVVTELTADFSTTATIPYDATIPQSGEGTEYITAAITPTNASSILEIEAQLFIGGSTGGIFIAALFKDSDANAIESGGLGVGGNIIYPYVFRARISAASTSARTYKLRVGSNGITVYVNRSSGTADLFGATVTSRMIIREILP